MSLKGKRMSSRLLGLIWPSSSTKYLFFGGKGGVGKTTVAAATAIWFADCGKKTTIISTDPTVSLSAIFGQQIDGKHLTQIRGIPNLAGLNINPNDAVGVFQTRLRALSREIAEVLDEDALHTPCSEEMATFDQFVTFLENPPSEVIVFDTAPTGKSLREIAMPFNWAGFLRKEVVEGKRLGDFISLDSTSIDSLEKDEARYEIAIGVLRDTQTTVFTLVLLPERLPIEETHSAISSLGKLGIRVQALVVNQCLDNNVVNGNKFLEARRNLQARYIAKIDSVFSDLTMAQLPLLDRDVSDVSTLREIGNILYGLPLCKS